jgi:hypothetical protein
MNGNYEVVCVCIRTTFPASLCIEPYDHEYVFRKTGVKNKAKIIEEEEVLLH